MFTFLVIIGILYYSCVIVYYTWLRWVEHLSHNDAYELTNKVFYGTK